MKLKQLLTLLLLLIAITSMHVTVFAEETDEQAQLIKYEEKMEEILDSIGDVVLSIPIHLEAAFYADDDEIDQWVEDYTALQARLSEVFAQFNTLYSLVPEEFVEQHLILSTAINVIYDMFSELYQLILLIIEEEIEEEEAEYKLYALINNMLMAAIVMEHAFREPISTQLLGQWGWAEDLEWVYTFSNDNIGTRGVPNQVQAFMWEVIEGNTLLIYLEDEGIIEPWYVTISGNVLVLDSLYLPGLRFVYTGLPAWRL